MLCAVSLSTSSHPQSAPDGCLYVYGPAERDEVEHDAPDTSEYGDPAAYALQLLSHSLRIQPAAGIF